MPGGAGAGPNWNFQSPLLRGSARRPSSPGTRQRRTGPWVKMDDDFWAARFADINAFERHLSRNGTLILKFFLHISKGEQRKRLIKRLKDPKKNWKFSPADIAERAYWNEYMKAYEEVIGATSTKWAPWHIIPANHKWVSRALVARFVTMAIEALDLQYPKVSDTQHALIADARKQLEAEKGK